MPDDLQPIIPIMVLYYNALITARSLTASCRLLTALISFCQNLDADQADLLLLKLTGKLIDCLTQ